MYVAAAPTLPSESVCSISKVCFLGFFFGFCTFRLTGLVHEAKAALSSEHWNEPPASPEKVNVALFVFDYFFGPLEIVGATGPVVSTLNACVAVLVCPKKSVAATATVC